MSRIKILVYIAVVFCAVVVALSSCNPEKRIARILKRHPELVKTDTVWKKDTIIIPGASKDSSFHFWQTDTVILKQDNLTVKYIINNDSTVFLSGKCDTDTIYKYYPVQVNSVSVKEALTWGQKVKLWIWSNWWWVLGILWLVWQIFGTALKTYFPFLRIF